ncbi:hypothetical protein V8E51_020020 [Hyaloscypha variabilis]
MSSTTETTTPGGSSTEASWVPNELQTGIFSANITERLAPEAVDNFYNLRGAPLDILLIEGPPGSGRQEFAAIILGVQLSEGKSIIAMTKTESEAEKTMDLITNLITQDEVVIVHLTDIHGQFDLLLTSDLHAIQQLQGTAGFSYTLAGTVLQIAGLLPTNNSTLLRLRRDHLRLANLLSIPPETRTPANIEHLSTEILRIFDVVEANIDMLISPYDDGSQVTNAFMKRFSYKADVFYIPHADEISTQTIAAIWGGEKPCIMTHDCSKVHRRGYGELEVRITSIKSKKLQINHSTFIKSSTSLSV